MVSKYFNLIIVTVIFIVLLSINFSLYFYIVPYLNLSDFSYLGFISNDSYVFHSLTLNFLDKEPNFMNFIGIFYDVNFHVFFLSIFYFFNLSPFYYTLTNIILVIFCILIAFEIIDQKIESNKKNQIFIAKSCFTILTIFLPSNFFFYSQIGKECFVILSLFYLIKFFILDKNLFPEKKRYLKLLCLFLAVHVLVVSKDYIIFSFIFFAYLICLAGLASKKIKINKFIFFKKIFLISLLALIVIILKFFFQLGNTANFLDYYNNVVTLNLEKSDLYSNFIYENNHIFDNLSEPFNKIRYFLINFSLLNGANSLISTEIPINFYESVILYLKTLFFAVIYPANYLANEISTLNKIAISENLIYFFLISSIFLKKGKNIYELLLISFFVFILSVILYLNPNVGSFYKQKSLCLYTMAIYGIINWINIFQYINKNIFITLNNKNNYNDISNISSNSFKILILIVVLSILTLFRDLFIINFSIYKIDIEIYLLIILSMSIVSNSINTPLNELLINYYYQQKKIDIKFLAIILFCSFCINIYIFKNITTTDLSSYIYIITLLIIFYISILINSFINSFFIYNKKIFYIYFSQSLSIIVSLIFLFFNMDNLSLKIMLISLNIWIISCILLNILFVNYDFKNILERFNYKNLNKNDFSNFLNNYCSYILLNSGIIILIIFSSTKFIDDYSLVISIRLYLYLLGILIVIFNLIISPYLFKNSNDSTIDDKITKFIELVFISSLFFIFIILISFDWLLDIFFFFSNIENKSIINHVLQILILSFPFVILNYFFTKKLLSIKDFKTANIINSFATLLFIILIITIDKKNIIYISYYFLLANILQFLMFNYLVKNQDLFKIDLVNLIPVFCLIIIFVLTKYSFIDNYFFILVFPISIIYFKKNFYE